MAASNIEALAREVHSEPLRLDWPLLLTPKPPSHPFTTVFNIYRLERALPSPLFFPFISDDCGRTTYRQLRSACKLSWYTTYICMSVSSFIEASLGADHESPILIAIVHLYYPPFIIVRGILSPLFDHWNCSLLLAGQIFFRFFFDICRPMIRINNDRGIKNIFVFLTRFVILP